MPIVGPNFIDARVMIEKGSPSTHDGDMNFGVWKSGSEFEKGCSHQHSVAERPDLQGKDFARRHHDSLSLA